MKAHSPTAIRTGHTPMRQIRSFFLGLALLTLCSGGGAFPAPAHAEDAIAHASSLVQDMGNDVLPFLQAGVSEAQLAKKFDALLDRGFDVSFTGRFVLGRYWRVATPEQQAEYLHLFERLIVQTYVDRFKTYAGETFDVLSGRQDGRDVFVLSRITRPGGAPPIDVDWRVRPQDGGYKIIDVVVEGVSMAITQRNEVAAVIQRKGGRIEGLLEDLRKTVNGRAWSQG